MNNLIALESLDTLLSENKGAPVRLAAASDDGLIIAGTTESGITLWDTQPSSGQETQIDLGLQSPQGKFYLNHDGSQIALIPEQGVIEVRQLDSQAAFTIPVPTVVISATNAQAEVSLLEEPGQIDALALSPDGDTLAGAYCSRRSQENIPGTLDVIDACLNREILVWQISTAELQKRISTEQVSPIRSLAFNPQNSNSLAAGYQDASIQFWDIDQARRSGLPLIGMGGPVTSLAFHQDGDVLASGSENKLIALWNLSPPQLIGDPFTGADGAVTGLSFSSDNSILFSGTDAGTITRWNIAEWKQLACRLAGRNLTQAEWEQFFPHDAYQATCEQYPLQIVEVDAVASTATPTPTGTPTPAP